MTSTFNLDDTTDARLRSLHQKAFDASVLRGVSGLAAWTSYLADVREIVNHFRGLEVADLLFLDGLGFRGIVELIRQNTGEIVSHQAVADWLNRYGPQQYLTVREADGGYALDAVPVLGTYQTRRELTGLQAIGRRVAPARWEITDAVDPALLWQALGEGLSRHAPAPAYLAVAG